MDTYEGKCKYCGAEKMVMAESQAVADEEISNTCSCGAASIEQRKAKLMERINYIACGSQEKALVPLSEEQTKMLRRAGTDIIEGSCDKIVFALPDSKVRIWSDGEKYKIKRTATKEEVAEA